MKRWSRPARFEEGDCKEPDEAAVPDEGNFAVTVGLQYCPVSCGAVAECKRARAHFNPLKGGGPQEEAGVLAVDDVFEAGGEPFPYGGTYNSSHGQWRGPDISTQGLRHKPSSVSL